jgi:hypothetical protein
MFPHERSLVEQLKNEPFAIVGVDSDTEPDKLREALQKENLTWRSFFDGGGTNGPIATAWNISGWPTIYVLDASGRIRFKDLRGQALEDAIRALLAELAAGKAAGK